MAPATRTAYDRRCNVSLIPPDWKPAVMLLAQRHQAWVQQHRLAVVQPPAQLWDQRAQVNG